MMRKTLFPLAFALACLLAATTAFGFSIVGTGSQEAEGAALSGDAAESLAASGGNGSSGTPWLYDWAAAAVSADLVLGGNKVYTNNGNSFKLDLNDGTITGNDGSLGLGTNRTGANNHAGDLTVVNTGDIEMGGINTSCNSGSTWQNRAEAGKINIGTSGDPVGNIKVAWLKSASDNMGLADNITLYGSGNVLIEDSGGSAGDIDSHCYRRSGGGSSSTQVGAGDVTISQDGQFHVNDIKAHIGSDNWGWGGNVTLDGDLDATPDGTCEIHNITTYNSNGSYNGRAGNVTISGYTQVTVNSITAYNNAGNTYYDGGDVSIAGITGDVTIQGSINLNSKKSATYDGTLTLESLTGTVTVASLNLDNVKYGAFDAAGNSAVQGSLTKFDPADPHLRTPSGQTITYDPFASGNGYLGFGTYTLRDLGGTLGAGGQLAPAATSHVWAGDDAGQWTSAAFDDGAGNSPTAAGQVAQFGTSSDYTPTVVGTVVTGALRLQDETPYDIQKDAGGGTVQLEGSGGGSAFVIAASSTVDHTVSADVELVSDTQVDTQVAGHGVTLASPVSGSKGLTKIGPGQLTLSATNSYTGDTTVNDGTLAVTGSLDATTTVNVEGTGVLAGNGTVGTVSVQGGGVYSGTFSGAMSKLVIANGGTLSPGGSVGQVDVTGAGEFAGGGSYDWEINSALGTEGASPGWDYVTYTGSLNVSATSGNPFTVDVTTLDGSVAGEMANFNYGTAYSWPIANAAGGVSVADPDGLAVDASGFQNPVDGPDREAGTFSVEASGDLLVVNYTPGREYGDYEMAVKNDNPIAWWRVNDAGNPAVNKGSLGSAVNATYTNGVTLQQPGLIASDPGDLCVSFDGANDLVQVPNHTAINDGGGPWSEKSIELWFDADDVTTRQVLFEQGGGTRGLSFYLVGGKLYAAAWNLAEENWEAYLQAPVVAGETYHAVLVMDGTLAETGTLVAYLNGDAGAFSTAGGTPGSVGLLYNHSGAVGIGGMYGGTYFHDIGVGSDDGYYYDGFLDEVALYNELLSQEDVMDHYLAAQLPEPIPEPAGLGLVGLALLSLGRSRQAKSLRRGLGLRKRRA